MQIKSPAMMASPCQSLMRGQAMNLINQRCQAMTNDAGYARLFVSLLVLVMLTATNLVQAQTPQRGASFTYDASSGLLTSETVEPDNPALCVTTTYTYDAYGNKAGATVANCSTGSVPASAQFASRTSSSNYAPSSQVSVTINGVSVAIPQGLAALSVTNALNQSETRTIDPRFGNMLSQTGPNGLTTSWQVDDFGRKILETRADGTKTVLYYCILTGSGLNTSSNTSGCPTPTSAEIPIGAIQFVHSEPRDINGAKMGPFARVYTDRAGRALRTVTESYDASSQPSAVQGALIVQDTVYSQYGSKIVTSGPYFLASGSSATAGSNDVGASLVIYDALGRPKTTYSTDEQGLAGTQTYGGNGAVSYGIYGARRSALTTYTYAGQTTTVKNDKGQIRTENKNANGEVILVTDPQGAQLARQYDAFGNLTQTKDALQNTITIQYDVRGHKTQMTDPDTGVTVYCYDALGQIKAQQNAKMRGSNTAAACPATTGTGTTATSITGWTTAAYDILGRTTQRIEPEYSTTWSYDTYANASACTKGIGKLCEVATSNGLDRVYVYDSKGRPVNSRETVTSGPSFASAVSYDATTGRVTSKIYPTGLQINYGYTSRGYLQQITLATAATVNPLPATVGGTPAASTTLVAGSVLWQNQIVDARGKSEQQSYGNGVITKASFAGASGRINTQTAGLGSATNILNESFNWDSLNNLTGRSDANGDGSGTGALSETFVYDGLNRLTQYTVADAAITNLARQVTLQYNALGSLLYKSDTGTYSYPAAGSAHPHAIQSMTAATATSYTYDLNGNLISASGGRYRSISYTSFNLPDSNTGISGPGVNGASADVYTWAYDESHARIKEVRAITGGTFAGTRTTWYMHPDNAGGLSFESEVNSPTSPSASNPAVTSNRHYITAGGTTIGLLVSTGNLPTLSTGQTAPPALSSITLVKVEYWHIDHLGSLAATSDHSGALTARYSYDPFGKRRYANGVYDGQGNLVIDYSAAINNGDARGFTGHEQLDDIGLVHMNGRLFDPALGVFLQSDPLMQDPDNLQNYNRYGYCYNNPLTCTDPSGLGFLQDFVNTVGDIAGAAANAVFGVEDYVDRLASSPNIRIAASIVVAYYLGPAAGNSMWINVGNPVLQTAVAGFVSGAVATGNVDGAIQGAFTALLFYGAGQAKTYYGLGNGSLGAVAIHAAAGCISSVMGDGKCGSGALSAAFGEAASKYAPGIGKDATALQRIEGLAVSTVVGGTGSVLGGGKFANGAQTAAFGYLFNAIVLHDGVPTEAGGATVGDAIIAQANRNLALSFEHLLSDTYDAISDDWNALFKSDSRKLAQNITSATQVTRASDEDAHHIVAVNDPRAAPARAVLSNVGMDINSSHNGVFLDSSQHASIHTGLYYETVNSGLAGLGNYNQVTQRLATMRLQIQAGTFPH